MLNQLLKQSSLIPLTSINATKFIKQIEAYFVFQEDIPLPRLSTLNEIEMDFLLNFMLKTKKAAVLLPSFLCHEFKKRVAA